jgi:acetyl esterase/lipase
MSRIAPLALLFCLAPLSAQDAPAPTHPDVRYGSHERNVLDLYLAPSDTPAPLVIFIHGGGFRQGDKKGVSAKMIRLLHEKGVSVASLNYPLTDTEHFPRQMLDPARAVQFLRHNAGKWNLDPTRFGATGGSAGAGISLWIGFHDDLADPKSADPIGRESTRLTAMAVSGAQISYDPRWIKEHIGGRAHEHPALMPFWGLTPGEMDTPKARQIFHDCSPVNFLTADDPPVWVIYRESPDPLPADAKPGDGIHHPNFGKELKKRMDALGIECVVKHATDYPGGKMNVWPRDPMDEDIAAFFIRHFGL